MFLHALTLSLAMLLTGPGGDARLPEAAMNGDRALVQSLLKQKVDVNTALGDGMTALHWAAFRDDLEMATVLIQAGADAKTTTRIGAMTPLFMACNNGSSAMIELFLNHGDDVNAANTVNGA